MNRFRRLKLYLLGVRFPKTVLLSLVLLCLLGFHSARKLHIENDLFQLLPAGTESVQNLKKLQQDFGGMGHLIVTVESQDPDRARAFADEFAGRIEKNPEVRYVDYRRPVDYFKERQWLYLDTDDLREMERRVDRSLELEKKGVSAAFSRLMDFADEEDRPDLTFRDLRKKYEDRWGLGDKEEAPDAGRFLVLRVKSKESAPDLDANRRFVAEVKAIEEDLRKEGRFSGIQVGYAGDYQRTLEDADQTATEVSKVSWVVTLLLFGLYILYFRRLSPILLIGFPLLAGILWTGGILSLLFGHLSLITAFGAAILAGLGSDYGIYLLSRFYHERKEGKSFEEACELAFGETGRAAYASMVVTVGGFVALLFSGFGVFKEFGALGSIGLLANYGAMMLFLPSFLALAERLKAKFPAAFSGRDLFGWFHPIARRLSTMSALFLPRKAIFGISCALLIGAISIFSIPVQSKIYFEDGQFSSKKKSDEIQDRVLKSVKRPLNPTVLMIEGSENEEAAVRTLERFFSSEASKDLVFNEAVGLSTFIPKDAGEKREILSRIRDKFEKLDRGIRSRKHEVLESLNKTLQAPPATEQSLPEEIRRNFVSVRASGAYAIYLFSKDLSGSSENIRRYVEGIKVLKEKLGLRFKAADSNFVTYETLELIRREAPRGLALILSFLAAVLIIMVRPYHRAVLIFSHLALALIILSGVLWVAGIHLNIMNIVVFPIILGMAVDCFIQFSFRFDETGSVEETLRSDLPPALVSSMTSVIGFGGLLLVSNQGLRSVGWVAVLGLLIVTVLLIFVFPRCLKLHSRLRTYSKTFQPLKSSET